MGEHSKADGGTYLGTALAWIKTHRVTIIAFAAGVVAAVSAIKPDFPGSAVMSALHALLGV
ncbi:hypothetical protein ACFQ7F_13015 [Streptomyces sp. NPDC056486]|uniref:hypothetical protein n=1 Tax=Streptomyces sp. NPDC056486 TaxID=3345835 RepID=UPI0036BD9EB8